MAEKKPKEPEKEGWERIQALISEADKDPKKKKGPPIYEPGTYVTHLLASLAYIIPIVDSQDLGKYMFEAYPAIASVYNGAFGSIAGIYNGVPFLPFAVFFLMSYICRAPTFPVEVRFHFAQAFMLSIIQFVPSLGFGLLEKAGVPGMAVLYNTGTILNVIS
jgi:Chloroplast import apparatus Tic20-like